MCKCIKILLEVQNIINKIKPDIIKSNKRKTSTTVVGNTKREKKYTIEWDNQVDLCTDVLYYSFPSCPCIPETVFMDLIKFAIMSVEFSFDNVIYM